MLDAIGSFFESLIDTIASFPAAVLESISSFGLGSLTRLADFRWLILVVFIILVVYFTYRDRNPY